MWRFSVAPFTGTFFERSGHKYQLPDTVWLSVVFLTGELPKKSCFLFGIVFAILQVTNVKQAKHDIRPKLPTNNAVQTTDLHHYGETSSGNDSESHCNM